MYHAVKWTCIDSHAGIAWKGLVGHRNDDIVHVFQVRLRKW